MERYKVGASSMFLATRERGRRMREDVEGRLAQVAPGDALVLDFSGVEGITVSFGDELVAKLILGRESGDFADRGMVIEGAGEDVRETLESVLARRKLAAVAINASAQPEMLGEQGWLRETLDAALRLQSFSASQLAGQVGITPQAANNRLRVLVASGAVAKERGVPEGGGKEFSYRAVIPAHA
ncbi:MAG TPA: STAS-like domain-containing protein [Micromonosporaceae bacterium]|nr:STAS-like domain-containing protein [Micromonosporaceae bacterium]